ncbi:MAG: hypothetical protein JOY72_09510 [Actinobacteria bacterium]|nr:hypothetical protein [Actinomycetota bacterium]
MRAPGHRTRIALVALVATAALVAAGASAARPAATRQATPKCWLQVVNDWLAHGQVQGVYAVPCYTQAIQHLDAYPDIKQYSSAIDDIHRALLYAIQHPGSSGPSSGPGGGSGNTSGGGAGGGSSGGGGGSSSGKSFISRVAGDIGPGNAQSIPLPLLVLGGLAVLLLLSAAGTWLARRLQARRITPTPAPARAGSTVRREP